MGCLDFARSWALNNVPAKKIDNIVNAIASSNETTEVKNVRLIASNRYAESNIPVEYWPLSMDKHFVGDARLKDKYTEYVADINASFVSGKSICFAGNCGVGKTMTIACILKKCSEKGYSCLYTTLSDIISVLTQGPNDERFAARRELIMCEFVAIDEIDPRYIASDNASDLFARSLEGIFRTRSQNKLPTLMSTNSPHIIESFNGQLKASLNSLFNGYMEMFLVFGADQRKKDVK